MGEAKSISRCLLSVFVSKMSHFLFNVTNGVNKKTDTERGDEYIMNMDNSFGKNKGFCLLILFFYWLVG